MNKACRDFLSSHHLYMLWSSSSVSYQFCCYFIKFSTLSWILVRPLHCQCYAQSTLFPRPTQKQVGEEPGNEAEAQLPAAVRELRPRQNEPRGPFLESPGNFSGPKSNIQIEIKRIRARVLASKLLHFVSLTDSFMMLDAKLLKPRFLM